MAKNHITKNKRFYQNFVAWLHFIVHNGFTLLVKFGSKLSPLRLLQGLPWTIRVPVP